MKALKKINTILYLLIAFTYFIYISQFKKPTVQIENTIKTCIDTNKIGDILPNLKAINALYHQTLERTADNIYRNKSPVNNNLALYATEEKEFTLSIFLKESTYEDLNLRGALTSTFNHNRLKLNGNKISVFDFEFLSSSHSGIVRIRSPTLIIS